MAKGREKFFYNFYNKSMYVGSLLIILLFFILHGPQIVALDRSITFKYWDRAQERSNLFIAPGLQDDKGFFWVRMEEEIACYHLEKDNTFSWSDSSECFPSSMIYCPSKESCFKIRAGLDDECAFFDVKVNYSGNWSKQRQQIKFVCSNLNSEDSALYAKIMSSDEIRSEMNSSLNSQIKSAPWFSWYAYFLYGVIFIFVFYLIQKIRLSGRLKKKVQELERIKVLLEEANHQLDQLSRMDGLTGIPNRRALDNWLEKEWAFSMRENKMIAILMLDIDFFKRFNDCYGHVEGDICLRTVAAVIQKSLQRTTDFCARYGGEEFAVVLHDSSKKGALLVASRILRAVDELNIPHKMSSTSPFVTLSIGVATQLPETNTSYQALLEAADQALYRAKSSGRHRVSE